MAHERIKKKMVLWSPIPGNILPTTNHPGFKLMTLNECQSTMNSANRPIAQLRWVGDSTTYFVLETLAKDPWLAVGDVAVPFVPVNPTNMSTVFILFVKNDPAYCIQVPMTAFTWLGDDKGSGNPGDLAVFSITGGTFSGTSATNPIGGVGVVLGDVIADYGGSPINPNYGDRLIGAVLQQYFINIALADENQNPPQPLNPNNTPYFIGGTSTDNMGPHHLFQWISRTTPYATFRSCVDPPSASCNDWFFGDIILPAQVGACCANGGTVPFTVLNASDGLVTQTGTVVTGSGTNFTANMVNGSIYVPGIGSSRIQSVQSTTSMNVTIPQTITVPSAYTITYSGPGSTNCGPYGISGGNACQNWITMIAQTNPGDPNVQDYLHSHPGQYDTVVGQIAANPQNANLPILACIIPPTLDPNLPPTVQQAIKSNLACYEPRCNLYGYKLANQVGQSCNLNFQQCLANQGVSNLGQIQGQAQLSSVITCAQNITGASTPSGNQTSNISTTGGGATGTGTTPQSGTTGGTTGGGVGGTAGGQSGGTSLGTGTTSSTSSTSATSPSTKTILIGGGVIIGILLIVTVVVAINRHKSNLPPPNVLMNRQF